MKMRHILTSVVFLVTLVFAANFAFAQDSSEAVAFVPGPDSTSMQGTAINYQGQLHEDNQPVNGNCDFWFSLWDSLTGGSLVGSTIDTTNLTVDEGMFMVDDLDFGSSAFNGEPRWLQIEVRCPTGVGSYQVLSPRTAILATPYALYSADSDKLDGNQATDFYSRMGGDLFGWIQFRQDTSNKWNIGYIRSINPAYAWFFISDPDDSSQPERLIIDKNTGDVGIVKNLGIGTTTPTSKLQVLGDSQFDGDVIVANNLGIGTDSPEMKFHVDGESKFNGRAHFYLGGAGGRVSMSTPEGGPGLIALAENGNRRDIVFGDDGLSILTSGTSSAPLDNSGIFIQENGNVGVGTTSPDMRFHVSGESQFDGRAHFYLGSLGGRVSMSTPPGGPGLIALAENGNRRDIVFADDGLFLLTSETSSAPPNTSGIFIQEDGYVGVGTNSPQTILDVAGTARTEVLQITGGDLAEPFLVNGEVEPGMVVVIDPDNPGQLRLSTQANDRLVAGCVSGANNLDTGILMYYEIGEEENAFPVALSGRVYCWADAAYGAIQPGDLLTTSDTPGHLMVVKDYASAQGAIVGKAMSSLEEGSGLILILVTLQ